MSQTWILTANAGRAQIFATEPEMAELEPIYAVEHADSRKHAAELVSDDRGRSPAGWGSHTALEPRTSPHQVEVQRFARELADHLKRALDERRFEALVLAAEPRFLGLLRGVLDPAVRARVSAELDRDYTRLAPRDLAPMLRKKLRATPLLG